MKNIKNIFEMAKADKYTADGREEIIKAKEAETEDVKYNPGDISKATGLQKQPDGSWAPPKKTQQKKPAGSYENTQKFKDIGSMTDHLAKQTGAEPVDIVDNDDGTGFVIMNGPEGDVTYRYKNLGDSEGKEGPYVLEETKEAPKEELWEENEDYLGNKRISMKTPYGGKVSIYETNNPKQKNARFRVDTGTHYNEFNTMEEAKAFAEKHWGPSSKDAAALTGDTKIKVKK